MLTGLPAAGVAAAFLPTARAHAASGEAAALLGAMGAALGAASTMRLATATTMDAGANPPFPAVYRIVGRARVLYARPGRLRVQYGGEPPEAGLLFDGTQTIVFLPRIGARALLPAPSGGGQITGVAAEQAIAPITAPKTPPFCDASPSTPLRKAGPGIPVSRTRNRAGWSRRLRRIRHRPNAHKGCSFELMRRAGSGSVNRRFTCSRAQSGVGVAAL